MNDRLANSFLMLAVFSLGMFSGVCLSLPKYEDNLIKRNGKYFKLVEMKKEFKEVV